MERSLWLESKPGGTTRNRRKLHTYHAHIEGCIAQGLLQ